MIFQNKVKVFAEKKIAPLVKFSRISYLHSMKKGKRKVQGVPQSQIAALPRHQEKEKTDKSKQAQIDQTYEKHYLRSALSSPSEVIAMLKGLKNTRINNTR